MTCPISRHQTLWVSCYRLHRAHCGAHEWQSRHSETAKCGSAPERCSSAAPCGRWSGRTRTSCCRGERGAARGGSLRCSSALSMPSWSPGRWSNHIVSISLPPSYNTVLYIRILSLKDLMSFQAALVPHPPPSRGVRSLPLGERVHAIRGGARRLEVVGEGGASRPRRI